MVFEVEVAEVEAQDSGMGWLLMFTCLCVLHGEVNNELFTSQIR